MFRAANINSQVYSGSDINISKGMAEITFELNESFHHALNAAHGSVYFKMLDDAAYFAASSQIEESFIVTKSFQIDLIRPLFEEKIIAKGKIKDYSEDQLIATSELFNEHEKLVGRGKGIFVKSKWQLSEDKGYKI